MVFSNKVKISGADISRAESTKYLGVHIYAKLKWSNSVNYIKGKIAKAIGVICKARTYLNR